MNEEYNFKLVEYPNGSVQIRLYGKPVGGDPGYDPEDDPDFLNFLDRFPDFGTGQFGRSGGGGRSPAGSESRHSSLARTRRMVSDYARCASWEWFVTFTYDGKKVDRTDFGGTMKKIRNWLNNMRKRFAPDLKYLVVPELHKDLVSWHCHLLLADTGSIEFVDSGHKRSGQIVYNVPQWRFGFSTATRVRDIFRIQKYVLKYLTKESHLIADSAHRFYASHNLPKPKVTTFLLYGQAKEDKVASIVSDLGMSISWRSDPKPCGDYTYVTYIELK